MKPTKLILLYALISFTFITCSSDNPGSSDPSPDSPSAGEYGIVSPSPQFSLDIRKVTVDMNKLHQEMEGFGASDCWLPDKIGRYWGGNRLQLARWLFSKNINSDGNPQGIGLSMWRVNLGAGTEEAGDKSGINNVNNRAEAYLQSDGTYDWNRCAGQRYFMQQAKNYGVESLVLFSNSPLVQFTLNGQGRSDNGAHANLKDDCYSAFAEYMAEVAAHFVKEGYRITHISPVNEPQYNWEGRDQEGSGWQNTEVARLARELDKSLSSRNLTTKILLSEPASWEYTYQGNDGRQNTIHAFFDSSSPSYVGSLTHVDKVMGGHSYWTFDNWNRMRDIRRKVGSAAVSKGVRVWQTEWSMLDKEPSELGAASYDAAEEFDIAQYMSRIIHNDIVMAGCSSWCYWTAMSVERYSQKNRFELIKTTPKGGEYSDDFTTGGKVAATPNLWVLGNYSLFVRPGFRLVELTLAEEGKNFFGTAYLAPDKSSLVLVITNYDKARGITLDMPLPSGAKSVWRYTTTKEKNLKQDQFNIRDKVFVDPASVTTIVYRF